MGQNMWRYDARRVRLERAAQAQHHHSQLVFMRTRGAAAAAAASELIVLGFFCGGDEAPHPIAVVGNAMHRRRRDAPRLGGLAGLTSCTNGLLIASCIQPPPGSRPAAARAGGRHRRRSGSSSAGRLVRCPHVHTSAGWSFESYDK